MAFIKKNKLKIIFFAVVLALLPTAIVKVPCPICASTGEVEVTNMSYVTINNVKATVGGAYFAYCGTFRIYITDVTVELYNQGYEDANGYMSLALVDYTTGRALDNQFVVVNIPARKRFNASYQMFFQTTVDDPKTIKVTAKIVQNMSADKACGGSGVVRMNEWPVYKVLSDRILEAQHITVDEPQFIPIFVQPEDWDITDPFALDVQFGYSD